MIVACACSSVRSGWLLTQHPLLVPPPSRRPQVVLDTLVGAVATQLMEAGCEVVSLYHRRLEHGYPTPSLERDGVLAQALPWLQQQGIWSRGRFGSYKVSWGVSLTCLAVQASLRATKPVPGFPQQPYV